MALGTCVRAAALAVTLALATGPASADDYQDAVDRGHVELDKFDAWAQQQSDALKQEIAALQQELQSSDSADKGRIQGMIDQADQLADDLNDQAKQIGSATSEQWEGVKASTLSGWHRAQAAYYAALAEVRGKSGQGG